MVYMFLYYLLFTHLVWAALCNRSFTYKCKALLTVNVVHFYIRANIQEGGNSGPPL